MSRVKPQPLTGQRKPRVKASDHLKFIHGLPCLICGAPGEAAHIRYADARYYKRPTGMAEKPSDVWCVPLCPDHHRTGMDAQHNHSELRWWDSHCIDPLAVATMLFVYSGNEEIGRLIIEDAMQ